MVELVTGLWFILTARTGYAYATSTSTTPTTLYVALISFAILGFLLIGLLVMDWQTHTLADAFTLSGIAIGLLLVCVEAVFLAPGQDEVHLNPQHSLRMSSPGSFASRGDVFLTGPEHLVYGRLLAVCVAALIPWLIRLLYKAVRHQEGLGLGDVKLMAMIAAFLGLAPTVLAFFVGVILGGFYGIVLLLRRRANRQTALPLGTFLCIGGLISALLSEPMIAWYRGLF